MKKIASLLLSFLMFFTVAAYAEVFVPDQGLQPEERGVAAEADPLNAYLILGESIQGSHMRLIEDASAKRYDELYNEKVVFCGKQGRQVYKENYLYISLEDDFICPNDHEIAIVAEYFCYDNGKGYFHFDYNSTNGNDYQRRSVQKSAPDAQWCTQTITIDDFELRHAQKNGADFLPRAYESIELAEEIICRQLRRALSREEELDALLTALSGLPRGEVSEPERREILARVRELRCEDLSKTVGVLCKIYDKILLTEKGEVPPAEDELARFEDLL